MNIRIRRYWVLGLIVVIALAAGLGLTAAAGDGDRVAPGRIDDGAELLDQASISLEDAVAAAQASADGALGEVDLESYEGRLVFNVDVGALDVKVDAADGTVLGSVSDDDGDIESD